MKFRKATLKDAEGIANVLTQNYNIKNIQKKQLKIKKIVYFESS